MNETDLHAQRAATAIQYFRLVDAADPALLELFADDAQMFFPKFGTAKGLAQIGAFAQGFARGIADIEHDIAHFNVLTSGDYVVVEGAVKGQTTSGVKFPDRSSSFGLFCNVFEFQGEKIKRLHIYEDPDFAGTHTDGVSWGQSVRDSM
ncbi:nuclear transport factor 2 family protein [Streptomyces sp. NPDC058464]|uniref:nuclear transport factor 2 family protein n=1 Tax=Streptomyces sp. NPDC058464 TaxID=3346511 RepID=UPI00365D1412